VGETYKSRNLPTGTSAEDNSHRLVKLSFDMLNGRQLTSKRAQTEGRTQTTNIPLFLVTLKRSPKSQETFKLTTLCHIAMKIEAYRAQNGLTQCYNCQSFGHISANCKKPPRCLWCGSGHTHRDCPEKERGQESTPRCCNYTLKDGDRPHAST
jgi:hypothetical protein